MQRKDNAGSASNGKVKIRGGKELAEDLNKTNRDPKIVTPNPINKQIKLNQFPWTDKQKEFFRTALDPSTKIVFVNGPAGTAKTLLSVYCGLQLLNMKVADDIMYLRSAVESSDKSLGYLPGDANEKLRFYNLPFLDKLDELLKESTAQKLEEQKRISMFPVNFARGMNWKHKCIILDEAQNSSIKEIITVLTRMGEGCRCFILADPMQTDLKNENTHGGFEGLSHIFSDEESVNMGIYTFEFSEEDIMRSKLVKFLIKKIREFAEEE
jgi:phosphate starvation-inducible PhoH-like protein